MLGYVLSFSCGLFIFPILYACIPYTLSMIIKKRRYIPQNKENLYITDRLKVNLEKSTSKTKEVAWFNVLGQRFYTEMIKNYAFESKIRSLLLKSFAPALKTGIIKNVRIVNIEFGTEAPYASSVKVLTKPEFESIVSETN